MTNSARHGNFRPTLRGSYDGLYRHGRERVKGLKMEKNYILRLIVKELFHFEVLSVTDACMSAARALGGATL